MPIVQADLLENVITGIFRARGVPDAEAGIVAAHLVDAEACGVTSHGVLRVPQYVEALADGRIVPGAQLRVLSETAATAVLDGQHGFGQVMALRAMDLATDRARRAGVGAVTLCNCSHTGRLGSYTEHAARQGLAALMMVNAGGHGQWVAPFGGVAGRLSTNPVSIAVPFGGDAALVLDMATSVAPEGKVRAALAAGNSLPEGWIIDDQGRPATNPSALYGPPSGLPASSAPGLPAFSARGALLPFGGHKGFGLALLIDALAGGLSGAGCCTDPTTPGPAKTDGIFLVAVQIAAFCPVVEFRRNIERLVQHVKSSPPAPGVTEVLVAGEWEARTKSQRLREGIPVEPATWEVLQQILDRSQLGRR
jgi:uncharacterized oxidoreductase